MITWKFLCFLQYSYCCCWFLINQLPEEKVTGSMDRYSDSRNYQCLNSSLNMAITQVLMAVVVLSLIPILCKHHLGVTEIKLSCWALQVNTNLIEIKITISIFQFLPVSQPMFLQTLHSGISDEQGPLLFFCNNNKVICSVLIFTFPYLLKMMSFLLKSLHSHWKLFWTLFLPSHAESSWILALSSSSDKRQQRNFLISENGARRNPLAIMIRDSSYSNNSGLIAIENKIHINIPMYISDFVNEI